MKEKLPMTTLLLTRLYVLHNYGNDDDGHIVKLTYNNCLKVVLW